ncbi:glycosyltransferase family 4 protein [Vibrio sp. RE86]|uniref:glycosyltransferase family 4 protein n=1 Tax=Vibrio sp. RE86 TaxID=2607605 RepID=UPI001493C4BB|nr:glycosyltransferase family 4 protein [Vibrio sp. RE86]NOH80816.1 glycosyltransferase family 4 protein [Vibrio sp. RE86]
MKILHICSDYSKQKIYNRLVTSLDTLGLSQQVYVPVRTEEEVGRNINSELCNTDFFFSNILKKHHRVFFRSKINLVYKNLVEGLGVNNVSLTHAHFLYSDGAAALRLKENYDIPYIVAVRNTDVNVFMKYRPDLKSTCLRILKNASRVILITPSYKKVLMNYAPPNMREELSKKISIIPNGLDEFWLNNLCEDKLVNNGIIKTLYVGDLSKNKNVIRSIRALELLYKSQPVEFTVVGSGGDGEKEFLEYVRSNRPPFVKYLGRIDSKNELLAIYRKNNIFLMPSYRETFGVSYLEALSQGLPIVFSQGQGVDGYFDHTNVSESVNPYDANDLAQKIRQINSDLSDRYSSCTKQAQRFQWENISQKYLDIYNSVALRKT